MKTFTTEQQWQFLGEFIKKKLDVGEPSPHMKIVGYLSKDLPIPERMWRAGCYAVPYSIITAEAIWQTWSLDDAVNRPHWVTKWVEEHWKNIHTRTERRCVRTPAKFNECLIGYANWLAYDFPNVLERIKDLPNEEAYDILWESISTVKYLGRYINIRILDLFYRYCDVDAHLYDIRSIGGWSPKEMLALLYPEHKEVLLGPGKHGDPLANKLATEAMYRYQDEGLPVDFYIFAAMLCEYRVAYENMRQYPGRTHDQEIFYFTKKGVPWVKYGIKFEMFDARKALFPHECLGELNGWMDIRDELSTVMRDYNYVWSDVEYSYEKTKDLANPVRRA